MADVPITARYRFIKNASWAGFTSVKFGAFVFGLHSGIASSSMGQHRETFKIITFQYNDETKMRAPPQLEVKAKENRW